MSESVSKKIRDLGLDTVNEVPTYMPNFPLCEIAEIRPRYPLHESDNTFEFNISGLNDCYYTIPNSATICGVVKVRKQNGGLVTAADNISCTNLFPHALFESISTYINDKQVSDTGRNAHHKAFITHNFGLNDSAKKKAAGGDFFLQNAADELYQIPPEAPEADSSGFTKRIDWIAKDKIRFNIPLTWDLQSTRYLTPGHAIKLIMVTNNFTVPLLARNTTWVLSIKFTDLKIRVRRFRLEEPGPEVISWYMKQGPQHYGINRVQMRRRAITHGALNVNISSIAEGQLPWHLLCMLVHRDQMNDLNKDPFCYQTHNLKEFQWIKNSLPYPNKPLIVDDTNIDSEGRITTYKDFQTNMGFKFRHADTGPSIHEFFGNQFLMAWNIPMCKCVGAHDHVPERGVIDLKLTFTSPVTNLDLLVMGIYDNIIKIDKNGIAETDFAI